MMYRYIIAVIFLFSAFMAGSSFTLYAQCPDHVVHTSGTQTINCVSVTVTSSGMADVLPSYCPSTTPYIIGYSFAGGSGNGSYSFSFSPPISAMTLNFSGASNIAGSGTEEIWLIINGTHYAIPAAGTTNSCDPLAMLTPGGDVTGCVGCSVSGWNGTNITGPISTLTVLDTVLNGIPNGALFSLFICTPVGGGSGVVNLGNDTTLCAGGTLSLDATTAGATYLWQDGFTGPVYTAGGPGTYWVQVTTACGIASDTIVVGYSSPPVVSLGNDTLLCSAGTFTLDATTAGATSYQWQDNSANPTLNVNAPGTYWVEVDVNGCTGSDTIMIDYGQTPVADLGNDTNLCPGQTLVLDATTPLTNYLWQDGSGAPALNVNTPGIYWVQLSNACGNDTDSITVTYTNAFTVNLGPDTNLCEGDQLVLDATTPGGVYQWQDNSANPVFTVSQQGTYFVNVTVNSCAENDTIFISYQSRPVADIGNDTSLCNGTTISLDATTPNAISYLWQDLSANPVLLVDEEGTYWVEVNNDCGSQRDSIDVTYIECDCRVFIPNTFTPNGDVYNPVFMPAFNCHPVVYRLSIFNRWGQEIFTSPEISTGWDGTYQGQPAPLGVYTYQVRYQFEGEILPDDKIGQVNLLR